MRDLAKIITNNQKFEIFIVLVILLNSFLIGVETYIESETLKIIQFANLLVFTIEIILRFIACEKTKTFFKDGWNIFDLTLVIIGYLPDTLFESSSAMLAFRVLRVLRVLRLLRVNKEIKLIVSVLLKSVTSLFYNSLLFLIFFYLFALIGVSLFKMPDPNSLNEKLLQNYEMYIENTSDTHGEYIDPFGDIGEALFTLFRELTGEDWTDVRYNLLYANELGLIKVNSSIITTYHVVWIIFAAFLLLNLVTGAILNNYQIVMCKVEQKENKNENSLDSDNKSK